MGINKQTLKNRIYKEINPLTTGLFKDEGWKNIYRIMGILENIVEKNGGEMTRGLSQYSPEFPNTWKKWPITINFINQNNREDKLQGYITAHGAGSVDYPLDRYDITVTIG